MGDHVAQVLLPAGAGLGRAVQRDALEERQRSARPLSQAIGETDETKAQDLWNQVQQIQYDEGGYLNWTNADWVDGLSNKREGHEAERRRRARQHDGFMDAWLQK